MSSTFPEFFRKKIVEKLLKEGIFIAPDALRIIEENYSDEVVLEVAEIVKKENLSMAEKRHVDLAISIIKGKKGENQEEKEKVQINVTIETEEKFLDFQKGCLHVSGRIIEGPEDIEGIKGKLQTISILMNKEYKIQKRVEDKFKWLLLFRRLEEKARKLVVLAVDSEEATLAIIPEVGEIEVQTFFGESSGKRDIKAREHLLSNFIEELEKALLENLKL
jgi:Predicted RNA-binding proteins